jgi:hypothetical protein
LRRWESMNEENGAEGLEIRVLESDTRNLMLIDRSDIAFAILYGVLFLWGLILTLVSI